MPSDDTALNDEEEEVEDFEKDHDNDDPEGSESGNSEETEDYREDIEDQEGEESREGTIPNPFYRSFFADEFSELANAINQIQIPTMAIQQMAEEVRVSEQALQQIAEEFTIPQQELQRFGRQMEITQEQLQQFEAANRAIARSINPEIFDIYRDFENSAILDLYEVVAAINQIEAEDEVEAVEEEEEGEEVQAASASDGIEKNTYNFVATYILNGHDFFSETSTNAAEDILQTDSVWEKRKAFTHLVRSADQQTRAVLEMTTHVALTFLLMMFFPASGEDEDDE